MKNLTIAFAIAMTLMTFGCKKKGGDGAGEAMAKMTEFKDEMCKCKDAKCAQDVSDRMTKWGQEQSKNQKEPPKMNEADTKKFQEVGEAMGKCMQTAMGAAMGGAPEGGSAAPAEGSAAPAEGSAAAGSAAPAAGSAAPAAEGSAAK
ncbi:MAG TPA: hypothetical protein VLB44_07200 [Kofleriaceae bacterium]|nr:hypothetical protein [Kofleriaceae bacterium]